ncbi:RNA binding protein [Zostera marina]|uniref:RNA binding protein n=1 Tax=Zostera marina TaxID=29655 RepID=A0A0K9Q2N4_ZOSMR|nr:RNA binding protein [Zostera marina]
MAFSSKACGLVRKSLCNSGVLQSRPAPSMHMFNAMRCMATKLFIGGLSFGTDDQTLKEAFSDFGEVTEARVIMDRMSGRSRGFGFIGFSTDEAAIQAMSSMDGKELHGRNIRVSVANDRPPAFGAPDLNN